MEQLVIVLGAVTAVVAAARSTWSPCGLSMLSTITPFSEEGRGHRYGVTAAWFVAGAAAGGATLGGLAALLSLFVRGAGLAGGSTAALVLAAIAAVAAVFVDSGVAGEWLPIWRRQVDDRWLGSYRGWVYGLGFGWQIGVGLATYIMTTAVFLTVVLAALTANPVAAAAIGTGFGVARGLAVLLTSRAATPADLHVLHRRLEAAGPIVREVVIVVELLVAGFALGWRWPWAGLLVAAGAASMEVIGTWRRGRERRRTEERRPVTGLAAEGRPR